MSVIIECNEKEIWSPSLKVGNLFFDQVKALEKNLSLESGLNSYVADTYEIDSKVFESFILSLIKLLESTNNGPYFNLIAGILEVLIALNEKITGHWPVVSEKLNPLLVKAKSVMNAIIL